MSGRCDDMICELLLKERTKRRTADATSGPAFLTTIRMFNLLASLPELLLTVLKRSIV
jgi:hypothetical protein